MKLPEALGKRGLQVFFALFLLAGVFYLGAGNFESPGAAILFGTYFLMLIANLAIFSKFAPGVFKLRSEAHFGAWWDKAFGIAYSIVSIALPFIAGLDFRYKWSSLGMEYAILGFILFLSGWALVSWAIIVNAWFEGASRIQDGQKAVSAGPYAFIRHPGYLGMIAYNFASALVLGSAVALIPALLVVALFVFRTYFEDKMLMEGLKGYKEYSENVKYRLIPFVW